MGVCFWLKGNIPMIRRFRKTERALFNDVTINVVILAEFIRNLNIIVTQNPLVFYQILHWHIKD